MIGKRSLMLTMGLVFVFAAGASAQRQGLTTYGNYCGPYHGDRSFKKRPMDSMDELCKKHDRAYQRSRAKTPLQAVSPKHRADRNRSRLQADKEFRQGLKQVGNPSSWGRKPVQRRIDPIPNRPNYNRVVPQSRNVGINYSKSADNYRKQAIGTFQGQIMRRTYKDERYKMHSQIKKRIFRGTRRR